MKEGLSFWEKERGWWKRNCNLERKTEGPVLKRDSNLERWKEGPGRKRDCKLERRKNEDQTEIVI